jgi:hypothetical protein
MLAVISNFIGIPKPSDPAAGGRIIAIPTGFGADNHQLAI